MTLASLIAALMTLSPRLAGVDAPTTVEKVEARPDLVAFMHAVDQESESISEAVDAVATSFFETGLRNDRRGDHGHSYCFMQRNLPPWRPTTREGWSGLDLEQDVNKCVRAGLEMLRWSRAKCGGALSPHRFAAYISGRCTHAVGQSKHRAHFATKAKGAL